MNLGDNKESAKTIPLPLVRLVAHLGISGKQLADILEMNASHLSRILSGERTTDHTLVADLGLLLEQKNRGGLEKSVPSNSQKKGKSKKEEKEEEVKRKVSENTAPYPAAAISEYEIFRVELHRPVTPEESHHFRDALIRRELFQKLRTEILYGNRRIITIGAEPNAKVGRSNWCSELAVYSSKEAPPEVRRTYYESSLAPLDGEQQSDRRFDYHRIAALVCADLGISNIGGLTAVQSIAAFFKYIERPLLLVRDGQGVTDEHLSDFSRHLINAFPKNTNFTLLMAAADNKMTQTEDNIDEIYEELTSLTPEDLAAYVISQTNISQDNLGQLQDFFQFIPEHLRLPSTASVLSGIYLLSQIENRWKDKSPRSPWEHPIKEKIRPKEASQQLIDQLRSAIDFKSLTTVEQIYECVIGKLHKPERELLYNLSVFNGRFSIRAAKACYMSAKHSTAAASSSSFNSLDESPLDLESEEEFQRILHYLFLSGTVINEGDVNGVQFLCVQSEIRDWLNNEAKIDVTGPNVTVKDKRRLCSGLIAKKQYFSYLERAIVKSFDYFSSHPFAADPGSDGAFYRLTTESLHIDNFLMDMWSQIDLGDAGADVRHLPLPTAISGIERIKLSTALSFKEKNLWHFKLKKVWLTQLCASLTLLWDIDSTPVTGGYHLTKARRVLDGLEKEHERLVDKGEEVIDDDIVHILPIIRVQLCLGQLLLQVRHLVVYNEPEAENLVDLAEKDLKKVHYEYGNILLQLVRGILANRKQYNAGHEDIRGALQGAIALSQKSAPGKIKNKYYSSISINKELRSLLARHAQEPLSRNLVFMALEYKMQAEFRACLLKKALTTGESFLHGAVFAQESRFVAQALINMAQTYWCIFSEIEDYTEKTDLTKLKPFNEAALRQVRDLLYKCEGRLANARIDQKILRGHYLALLGLYNIEKNLGKNSQKFYSKSEKRISEDGIKDRGEYGEKLLSEGLSRVSTYSRGLYQILLADAYLRYSLLEDPGTRNNWKEEWPHGARPLAISHFIRGFINSLGLNATEDGKQPPGSTIEPSRVFILFCKRFCKLVEPDELEVGWDAYWAMTESPPLSRYVLDHLLKLTQTPVQ